MAYKVPEGRGSKVQVDACRPAVELVWVELRLIKVMECSMVERFT